MQEFCALCSYFKIIILNFIYISFELFLQLELRFPLLKFERFAMFLSVVLCYPFCYQPHHELTTKYE